MFTEIYGLAGNLLGSLLVWLALTICTLTVFVPELIVKTIQIRVHDSKVGIFGQDSSKSRHSIQVSDQMEGGEMSLIKPVNYSGQSESTFVNAGYRTSIN